MKAYDICNKIAMRIACSGYDYYNPRFERNADGKLELRDRQNKFIADDADHVLYIIDDNTSMNAQEVWDGLSPEEQDKYQVYAYAAFKELSRIPVEVMWKSMWENYVSEK